MPKIIIQSRHPYADSRFGFLPLVVTEKGTSWLHKMRLLQHWRVLVLIEVIQLCIKSYRAANFHTCMQTFSFIHRNNLYIKLNNNTYAVKCLGSPYWWLQEANILLFIVFYAGDFKLCIIKAELQPL